MLPSFWLGWILTSAQSVTHFIKSVFSKSDPLARLLLGVIALTTCASFLGLIIRCIGGIFYDGVFAVLLIAPICILLIMLSMAVTHYGPERFRWSARVATASLVLTTIIWGMVDKYSFQDVLRDVPFEAEYLRLIFGATNMQQFFNSVAGPNLIQTPIWTGHGDQQ